jgi:hypothetical protein
MKKSELKQIIKEEISKVLSEVKIEYKDKPYSDGDYTPIETKIKYDNSDIGGVILKLLIGEASYINNLMVIYPYVSDPNSYKNRMSFFDSGKYKIGEKELKDLYSKLIDIFSKKEYSYSEVKNILDTIQDANTDPEYNEITVEDILDKIPSNLLSDEIKEFIEENFDDLNSYFDDVFDPKKLILKSPQNIRFLHVLYKNSFSIIYLITSNCKTIESFVRSMGVLSGK